MRLGAVLTASPPLTIAAAESCSGGEVAHRLTSVPGSSAYFLGSIVAYANEAKAALLGVPQTTLDSAGAVSEPSAWAMAEGARRAFGADYAVSTTGIAGPSGATPRKPVGLVYVALAGPNGTEVHAHQFPGDRTAIVNAAAEAALQLLADRIETAVAKKEADG